MADDSNRFFPAHGFAVAYSHLRHLGCQLERDFTPGAGGLGGGAENGPVGKQKGEAGRVDTEARREAH